MANSGLQNISWRYRIPGGILCFGIGVMLHFSVAGRWLDAQYLDLQIHTLKKYFPTEIRNDVLVVGIDEATTQAFAEPMTLWHRHWGDFLRAMQVADASAVGLDIVMPDRSFDDIVPGYDNSLLGGMLAAKKNGPVVLALTVDSRGKTRTLYRKFELIAGKNGLGFALFPRDVDQKVRRFDERLSERSGHVDTLVGQMARGMNLDPQAGYIDLSTGRSFQYIPMHEVIGLYEKGDVENLRRQFAGKPVLLGTVLPGDDRLSLPVNLAAWEDNGNQVPGVLLHAQTLRGLLNDGLVQPTGFALMCLGIFLAALSYCWSSSAFAKGFVLFACTAGMFCLGLYLFRHGTYLPISAMTATLWFAMLGRGGFDALRHLRERRLLKRAFGNSVSPNVMDEILSGQLTPELGGTRKFVCILFSDIRGFTTRSESMTPEAGIHLLNRYFECVVEQIHANGGAVINFMGDGIMAIFGEPKPLENPCASGFAAAKGMQAALAVLNVQLQAEGIQPIEIGVGVHAGEVVIGHMGSSNRNDYTAIGDAANVASRVEGLTKDVGYAIVCSKVIVDALSENEGLTPLGPQAIKGHTPVEVYGWGKL